MRFNADKQSGLLMAASVMRLLYQLVMVGLLNKGLSKH